MAAPLLSMCVRDGFTARGRPFRRAALHAGLSCVPLGLSSNSTDKSRGRSKLLAVWPLWRKFGRCKAVFLPDQGDYALLDG